MPSIVQTSLADLEHEIGNTRRMLERFPTGRGEYAPHTKSMSLGRLATHVAVLPLYGTVTMESAELDFAQTGPVEPPPLNDAAELVARFDGEWQKFKAALDRASDEEMMQPWTLRVGDHVIFTMPRVAVLRGFVVSHMIHHRAQLAVYLRMLDVPVPGMYGPTADEQ